MCLFVLLRIHPSPTAGSVTAASSVSTVQGKPSLRRIKGRIHRSKSLDSIDLMDSNVSLPATACPVQRETPPLTTGRTRFGGTDESR